MSRNRRNKRVTRKILKNCSKQIKIILPITIILICILILSIKIYKTDEKKSELEAFNNEIYNANFELTEEEKIEIENDNKRDVKLSISAIGNVLCENNVLNSVKDKEYDFSEIFSNTKKYISDSDLSLAPIETNFVNQDYSGYNLYNSPKKLAEGIKSIGTDIAFLANNHSMDYGINGINETINNLNGIGIENVGLQTNEKDTILIKEIRNIKIAFLSYTYGTNKKEDGYEKYVNLLNKENINTDIGKARQQGAEYIIASVHWGNTAGTRINKTQKEMSDFLIDSGVDIIIGNHPSSIQKMETRVNSQGKDILVVYSLGNFISSENSPNSNLGMILKLELIKLANDNKVYLNKVTYVPTYLKDNGTNSENRYKILDIKEEILNYENGIKNIEEKTYKKLKDGLVKIKELISR